MTSMLKGLVGTLSSALDFNQATLSGAIDIIVVRHQSGEMRSTPFHVRFGKLQLLRSREKVVTIRVNGTKAPFSMKMGPAGEAFFVEPCDDPVEDAWSTSPMFSPVSSPSLSPTRVSLAGDAEFASLDDRVATLTPAEKDTVVDMQESMEFVQEEIRAALQDLVDKVEHQAKEDDADDQVALYDQLLAQSEVGDDQVWTWWSWGWGQLPQRRVSQTHVLAEDERIVAELPVTRVQTAEHTERSNSWMESLFGMFRRSPTTERPVGSAVHPVNVRVFVTCFGNVLVQIDLESEFEAVKGSGKHKAGNEEKAKKVKKKKKKEEEEEEEELAAKVVEEATAAAPAISRGSSRPNLLSPKGAERMPTFIEDLWEDRSSRVEMSLCGGRLSKDPAASAAVFRSEVVTFERLCLEPDLVFRADLVVRYQELLYPGHVALPLIMSYLAFGRTLDDATLRTLAESDEMSLKPATTIDADQRQDGFLARWFGSSKASQRRLKTAVVSAVPLDSADKDQDDAKATTQASLEAVVEETYDPSLADVELHMSDADDVEAAAKRSFRKSMRPTSEMLKQLDLQPGRNLISFSVSSALQGTQTVEAYIYLWRHNARVVISDVDGTITRSDILGNIMPLMGKDWTHSGVTPLFSNIEANGYDIVYLTSRAIGQANVTRDYLHSVRQGEVFLPQGPLIMSPDSLIHSFKREVIYRRPQEFKIPALRDVANLFPAGHRPFFAGFGNRHTDIESYRAVGVPQSKIFIIDPRGQIHHTTTKHRTSYPMLNDQVEHMFPFFDGSRERGDKGVDPDFNSFNFWKTDNYYSFEVSEDDHEVDEEADDEEEKKPEIPEATEASQVVLDDVIQVDGLQLTTRPDDASRVAQ